MIRVTIETEDGVIFREDSADFEELRGNFADHVAAMRATVSDFLQDLRRKPKHRRNPSSKVEALITALKENMQDLNTYFEEYSDSGDSYEYERLIQSIFRESLGKDYGLSADFVNSAWLLDRDDIFLFDEDEPGEYSIIKQIPDEDGGTELEEVSLRGRPAYAHDHQELVKLLQEYLRVGPS